MKVKMLRTCFVDGKLAEKGKTVDAEKKDAAYLVNKKKAVYAEAKTEKADK